MASILKELFAPGNIDRVYSAEIKRYAEVQAESIRKSVMDVIDTAANRGVVPPGYIKIYDKHIYPENLEVLRDNGVHVFQFYYSFYDNALMVPKPARVLQHSGIQHLLVWDPELVKDLENMVIRPELSPLVLKSAIKYCS